MSGTVSIHYRHRRVWARSAETMVFLASLIRFVEQLDPVPPWLESALGQWRVQASVRDLGMTLFESWSDDQIGVVGWWFAGVEGGRRTIRRRQA